MKQLHHNFFTKNLLEWNELLNLRAMPWKGEKNPYLIWLSEIILQQTRVEQGLPYFVAFKKKFPTVKHLAKAKEDEVMKLWQGLGYYSRARNLHTTAKLIAEKMNGTFPETLEELKKLKGVGDYTAAAIASFAFGRPVAVVDGNVIRVLSRFFGIETPFDSAAGKKAFRTLAQQLIPAQNAAAHNQAIMDFGATVCTPQKPDCECCVLQKKCFAFRHNLADKLPVKEKALQKRERHFCYIIVHNQSHTFIRQRTNNDIWKKLYEFPLLESQEPLVGNLLNNIEAFLGSNKLHVICVSEVFKQMLTHQKLHIRFVEVEMPRNFSANGLMRVKKDSLHKFAFPKAIADYLAEHSLGLK